MAILAMSDHRVAAILSRISHRSHLRVVICPRGGDPDSSSGTQAVCFGDDVDEHRLPELSADTHACLNAGR